LHSYDPPQIHAENQSSPTRATKMYAFDSRCSGLVGHRRFSRKRLARKLDPSVGQGYRIWLIALKRKAVSQRARSILRRIEALSGIVCKMLSASFRRRARFSGAWSFRARLRSSEKWTSSTQCSRFSMPQWLRVTCRSLYGDMYFDKI